jgi:hypothetical protein
MGIPVVEGRAFLPTDALGTTVMINQTMARTFYKEQSPIGRRVRPSGPPTANIPWYTIVGVLKDVKQGGVDKKTGTELYFNFEQRANGAPGFNPGTMNIVMRATQTRRRWQGTIHQVVASPDLALPVVKPSRWRMCSPTRSAARVAGAVVGLFAGLALLPRAIGSYGVLSEHGDRSGGGRSASAWRSAPTVRRCCGWCWGRGCG